MFYHLSLLLTEKVSFFNVVHYVSFRMMASLLTALILSCIVGSWFIKRAVQFRSKAREYTPETHKAKHDTPTMGGLFILLTTVVTALMWCNLTKPEVWIFLGCLIGFGAIGLWDDLSKIRLRKGIKESYKFKAQLIVGFCVALAWYWIIVPPTEICVPFFKNFSPQLGLILIPWAVFVLIGSSNAVNLTDGLDGLAIGSLIFNFGTFALICYGAGNAVFAHYLAIPFTQTSEIAILGTILVGSSLGFLWYNAYPAEVWMGDVGSLSLGSGLALMALMARQELLLPLSGGLFVAETLSVIAQVISFRYTGKRLFKMAPLHHHFELLGWPETKITTRFGIITFVLCLLALITLKLR
jgi:phospho-N-acetylmuramoyl-pentapeptide-transferase